MSVPKQKPGRTKQDCGTPWELLHAVTNRFGRLDIDLAATPENTKCRRFITVEQDSLAQDWTPTLDNSQCWLNPPYADIEPWAAKCANYARQAQGCGRIYMLTPASVGANWFARHVERNAYVLFLQGRLTFVGAADPDPKDCMISVFGSQVRGSEVWDWRKDVEVAEWPEGLPRFTCSELPEEEPPEFDPLREKEEAKAAIVGMVDAEEP